MGEIRGNFYIYSQAQNENDFGTLNNDSAYMYLRIVPFPPKIQLGQQLYPNKINWNKTCSVTEYVLFIAWICINMRKLHVQLTHKSHFVCHPSLWWHVSVTYITHVWVPRRSFVQTEKKQPFLCFRAQNFFFFYRQKNLFSAFYVPAWIGHLLTVRPTPPPPPTPGVVPHIHERVNCMEMDAWSSHSYYSRPLRIRSLIT